MPRTRPAYPPEFREQIVALGKHEVTLGQYARFLRETGRAVGDKCSTYEGGEWARKAGANFRNPGYPQTDDHPAACVSWEDAQAYVRWLNTNVAGAPYRLPSEAELEYAIRAGRSSPYYWGADKNAGCRDANGADQTGAAKYNWTAETVASCSDGHAATAPVGSFRANAFGLHDMHGNVWEWAQDCWNDSYRGAPSTGAPWMSGDCSLAVLRGGAWNDTPKVLRSAFRDWGWRVNRAYSIGFRVARVSRTLGNP